MTRWLASLLALGLAAPAWADPPGPVVDLLLDGERLTLARDALIAQAELAPGQAARVVEVGRDAHTSHHVVAIGRGEGEPLHRHDHHELVVVVLRGHGLMRLGEETRPVGEGSVLYVPRGAVHAFANASDAPAYAFVLYAPPFDGGDRVLVAPLEEP